MWLEWGMNWSKWPEMIQKTLSEIRLYGMGDGRLYGLTCVLQTWVGLWQKNDLVTSLLWKDLLGRRKYLDQRREGLDLEKPQTTLKVIILIPFCRTGNETSGTSNTQLFSTWYIKAWAQVVWLQRPRSFLNLVVSLVSRAVPKKKCVGSD